MSIIVPSNHTRIGAWVSSIKCRGEIRTSILYNTINCHAKISHKHRRHGKLGLQLLGCNLVCYITSRIGWVSLKRIYRWYRCRRDPGKLYNNFCYTYLTKDQHTPSNLVVYNTIQYKQYHRNSDMIS